MRVPGFTADASMSTAMLRPGTRGVGTSPSIAPVVPQARLGGFGPTLLGRGDRGRAQDSCYWDLQMVPCGSALPGYAVPMCLEWVYVCKVPASSRA